MAIDARPAISEMKRKFGDISEPLLKRAISRSMNESVRQGRTIVKRSITDVYAIKSSYLKNTMMPIGNSTPSNLTSKLLISSNNIPISQFKAVKKGRTVIGREFSYASNIKTKKVKAFRGKNIYGEGVSFEIIKGQRSFIRGAFIRDGKYGLSVLHRAYLSGRSAYKSGQFQFRNKRISKGSDTPIAQLYTLSPFTAAVSKKVITKAEDKVKNAFSSRLSYHLSQAVNKL